MIVRKIITSNPLEMLDILELYCIQKEISYVKLPNEFHFLNYIVKLEEPLSKKNEAIPIFNPIEALVQTQEEIKETKPLINTKSSYFSKMAKPAQKPLNINTKGYPRRIRKR